MKLRLPLKALLKLRGLESSSHTSHKDYKADKRKVHHGKLLAYVQFQQKSGNVKVTFESKGLQPYVVNIVVK